MLFDRAYGKNRRGRSKSSARSGHFIEIAIPQDHFEVTLETASEFVRVERSGIQSPRERPAMLQDFAKLVDAGILARGAAPFFGAPITLVPTWMKPPLIAARRLHLLVLLSGNPEGIDNLRRESTTAGGVGLTLNVAADPDSDSAQEECIRQDGFVIAEAWMLLHHASETLFRLYFAHAELEACPWLTLSRTKSFRAFKGDVRTRFVSRTKQDSDLETISQVFYGTALSKPFSEATSIDEYIDVCDNVEELLRILAGVFLDSDSYNAAKHGFAIKAGRSRITATVGELEFFNTEGPHLEYLNAKKDAEGILRWGIETSWVPLELILQQVVVAQRMIDALWLAARARYLAEDLPRRPNLGSLRHEQLRKLQGEAGKMRRQLHYET